MPVDGGYTDRPDAPRILRVSPVAGYSDRLEVFLSLPDYRGSTPLEKVSVEVSGIPDVFDLGIPSDVGVDGVNGVFFSYKATPEPGRLGSGVLHFNKNDLLPESVLANPPRQLTYVRVNSQNFTVNIGRRIPNSDFKPEVEADFGVGIRHVATGTTAYGSPLGSDPSDPYGWPVDNAAFSQGTLADFLLLRGEFQIVLLRPSKRPFPSQPLRNRTIFESTDTSVESIVVDGLVPGSSYGFQAFLENASGPGRHSPTTRAATPNAEDAGSVPASSVPSLPMPGASTGVLKASAPDPDNDERDVPVEWRFRYGLTGRNCRTVFLPFNDSMGLASTTITPTLKDLGLPGTLATPREILNGTAAPPYLTIEELNTLSLQSEDLDLPLAFQVCGEDSDRSGTGLLVAKHSLSPVPADGQLLAAAYNNNLDNILGISSVVLSNGTELTETQGTPRRGEYAYDIASAKLSFHADDSLANAKVVIDYRNGNMVSISREDIDAMRRLVKGSAPGTAHSPARGGISLTVCYEADPCSGVGMPEGDPVAGAAEECQAGIERKFGDSGDDSRFGNSRDLSVSDGILPGGRYQIDVQGRTADGRELSWTRLPDAVATDVLPLSPPITRISTVSRTELLVRWSPPDSQGRSPVYGYKVRYRQGDAAYVLRNYSANISQDVLSSLIPGRIYEVQAKAVNAEGESEWSRPATGRTLAAGVPDKPELLVAALSGQVADRSPDDGTGDFTVRVDWLSPNGNGFPILQYELLGFVPRKNDKPYEKRTIDCEEDSQYLWRYEDEYAGGGYKYKLRARNEIGWGEWSDWSLATGFEDLAEDPDSLKRTFIYGKYSHSTTYTHVDDSNHKAFDSIGMVFLGERGQPLTTPWGVRTKARVLQMGTKTHGYRTKSRRGESLHQYLELLAQPEIKETLADLSRQLQEAKTELATARTQKYLASTKRQTSANASVAISNADVPGSGTSSDVVDVVNVERNGIAYTRVHSQDELNRGDQYYFNATTKTVVFAGNSASNGADITFSHRGSAPDANLSKPIADAAAKVQAIEDRMKELRSDRIVPEQPMVVTWEFARERSISWQVAYFDMSHVLPLGGDDSYVLAVLARADDGTEDESEVPVDDTDADSLVLETKSVSSVDIWDVPSSWSGNTFVSASDSKAFPYKDSEVADTVVRLRLAVYKSFGKGWPRRIPLGSAMNDHTIAAGNVDPAGGLAFDTAKPSSSASVDVQVHGSTPRRFFTRNQTGTLVPGQFRVDVNEGSTGKIYFHEEDVGTRVDIAYTEKILPTSITRNATQLTLRFPSSNYIVVCGQRVHFDTLQDFIEDRL